MATLKTLNIPNMLQVRPNWHYDIHMQQYTYYYEVNGVKHKFGLQAPALHTNTTYDKMVMTLEGKDYPVDDINHAMDVIELLIKTGELNASRLV